MEWDEVVDKAIDYFNDNLSELEEVADYIAHYDDSLYDRMREEQEEQGYYPMDFLDDYFSDVSATDILSRIDSDFDTGDDYFYLGGYSIESTNSADWDYTSINDDDFIQSLYDNEFRLSLPDYIEKLFEAFDEDEEDDEDDEDDDEI